MSNIDKVDSKGWQKTITEVDNFVVEFRPYTTELTQKFVNRKPWKPKDETKIISFIPGTIEKIFIKEGDHVEENQHLMILEAMKMKNIVFAPMAGKIDKINAIEGERVPKNMVIIEIIPD